MPIPATERVLPAELRSTIEKLASSPGARFVTAFAVARDAGAVAAHPGWARKEPSGFVDVLVPLDRGVALPSITTLVPAANWFEREMMELLGVPVEGHPDPRPLIQHRGWPVDAHPLHPSFRASPTMARLEKDPEYGFLKVEGDGVCEVPVGPIHAGVIEPGHFRFSVAGEPVINLEIRLGYQHKGVEKLHEGRTPEQGLFLAERTSGDNSVAHSAAYCMAVEALTGTTLPPRAAHLRVLFLELERITHHLGDIGGVLLDVAYNYGASQLAILREDMFRLDAELSGSRLLFGANAVGGVAVDPTREQLDAVQRTVARVALDAQRYIKTSLASASVVDRLDQAGTLTLPNARLLSVVGPAARASGLDVDARRDHPHAAYATLQPKVALETRGDVMARVRVKAAELRESARLVQASIDALPPGDVRARPRSDAPDAGAVGLGVTESHRGEVAYAIMLRADGRVARCHVRDASMLNWRAIELATANGNIIADFPVINKSFNLSYSGNDR